MPNPGLDPKEHARRLAVVLRSRTYGDLGRYKMPIEMVWDRIRKTAPDHYVPQPKRAFQG